MRRNIAVLRKLGRNSKRYKSSSIPAIHFYAVCLFNPYLHIPLINLQKISKMSVYLNFVLQNVGGSIVNDIGINQLLVQYCDRFSIFTQSYCSTGDNFKYHFAWASNWTSEARSSSSCNGYLKQAQKHCSFEIIHSEELSWI